jgi:hypothetical protein
MIGGEYGIYDMIGQQIEHSVITSDVQQVKQSLVPGIYQIVIRANTGDLSMLRYEVTN